MVFMRIHVHIPSWNMEELRRSVEENSYIFFYSVVMVFVSTSHHLCPLRAARIHIGVIDTCLPF